MNGSLDDFSTLPTPAGHVMVALLQSLQHEFSCLVQEQRNSNFSLARMELRMASLEDELKKLSNRVDILLEGRNLVAVEQNGRPSHVEQVQDTIPQPVHETTVSVTLSNDAVSNADSSSTVCLLDTTSSSDIVEHKEVLNLIPPSLPPPQPSSNLLPVTPTHFLTEKPMKIDKKRSRKEHTPMRNPINTMVVPLPTTFQDPEPACSMVQPQGLMVNIEPSMMSQNSVIVDQQGSIQETIQSIVQSQMASTMVQQTVMENKKGRRAEKPKKRQRQSDSEIPDEEIENLKNIIMREAAERAARQHHDPSFENHGDHHDLPQIKLSKSDGPPKAKNSRKPTQNSASPMTRITIPNSMVPLPGLNFGIAPMKLEADDGFQMRQ